MISRYQTAKIDEIWNEQAIIDRWTQIEFCACEVLWERGEISDNDYSILCEKIKPPAVARVKEIEEITRHDVVAFVKALGENVGEPQNRYIHRGLTSSDILDTTLASGIRKSLRILRCSCLYLQMAIKKRALEFKNTLCIGRTHGMHAEPTTYGLRLAGWYAEIARHSDRLNAAINEISYGKLSGAIGTFSQNDPDFEARVLEKLNLLPEPIATQVIPRDRHASVLSALAILGAGLERFAIDIRSLQRTEIGEVFEPFGQGQTGSSAMPHKRNPIISERICGMARLLRGYNMSALENIALWHERDISHSSVERVIIPDAFHIAHTMLLDMIKLVEGMRIDTSAMLENLEITGGLIFSQNVLTALIDKGMDRNKAYEIVQTAAMKVWNKESNSLRAALFASQTEHNLNMKEMEDIFSFDKYTKHLDALFERAFNDPHQNKEQ